MNRAFSLKSPSQMVTAVTITCMVLTAFLPINLLSIETEAIQYPFKLTTRLEKTTYNLREPVNIKFSIENIANENATINLVPSPFDFIVYDENFVKVYREAENVGYDTVYHPPHIIKPGEALNITEIWYQNTSWKSFSAIGTPDFEIRYYWAEPGNYYVTGIFYYITEIKTPPIRITII